jgi:hypothetical protein
LTPVKKAKKASTQDYTIKKKLLKPLKKLGSKGDITTKTHSSCSNCTLEDASSDTDFDQSDSITDTDS